EFSRTGLPNLQVCQLPHMIASPTIQPTNRPTKLSWIGANARGRSRTTAQKYCLFSNTFSDTGGQL
ncbi:MAG TPA: hypothetical protein PK706_18825, partial [Xanthobacteraceae bacterium]|nr:hypothetical protein [Xanthobacteraceae bacterium]